MAQNSTQKTGIAFSELKAEKKQLVTENSGKILFCQNFNRCTCCRQISAPSRERRSRDGYFKIPS